MLEVGFKPLMVAKSPGTGSTMTLWGLAIGKEEVASPSEDNQEELKPMKREGIC